MKKVANKRKSYSEKQTKKWLYWTAKNMQKHDQTIFLIENLQPSWLNNNLEKTFHSIVSLLIAGLIGGLIFGLIYGLIGGLIYGLIKG
jgi:predicted lipid-binding transport protein (Tim44 family)